MAINQRPSKPAPDLTGKTATDVAPKKTETYVSGDAGLGVWDSLAPGTTKGGSKSKWIAKTSPLTQEVQNREEQRAAYEALYGAAESDMQRRESILQDAETAGRRQAAEAMIQGTRGMEAGGARAAMGRQAAADTLMQQQQMAATRAGETPALDLANISLDITQQVQALGDLGTDRVSKMAAYQQLLDAYEPGDARDAALDALIGEAIRQGDMWVVNQLNGQFSTGPKQEYAMMVSEQTGDVSYISEYEGKYGPNWIPFERNGQIFYQNPQTGMTYSEANMAANYGDMGQIG
jgi:hypothetical protein